MEINAIAGNTPVLPVSPAPAPRVNVDNEATERVKDNETAETPVAAVSAPASSPALAPLNSFQGTKVDLLA